MAACACAEVKPPLNPGSFPLRMPSVLGMESGHRPTATTLSVIKPQGGTPASVRHMLAN